MKPLRLALALALALSWCVLFAGQALARSGPEDHIVVYLDSVTDVDSETDKHEKEKGFKSKLRFRRVLKGFAAKLSGPQVQQLRADPRVQSVEEDETVFGAGSVPLATGDRAPSGVRRIEAATATAVRPASSVGVAVLDSGIDLGHRDLNVVDGTDCIDPGTSAADEHGHGTHVAGILAAKNDGVGLVGVAPGTKLHSVRVLGRDNQGTSSSVICGLDWVTANAQALNIEVANLSLGRAGPIDACGTPDTYARHTAICNSARAGVRHVVAAMNNGHAYDDPATGMVPAAYPEVITATAMSDSDGVPGGRGGARCGHADDSYASFSNWASTSAGAAHTIAGPGVCVTSTAMGGGYADMSGTSMATPHVAGLVALCLGELGAGPGPCAGLTRPADLIAEITRTDGPYGFAGDPTRPLSGRFYGHLVTGGINAASPDTTPPPVPTGLAAAAGDAQASLRWSAVGAADLAGYDVLRAVGTAAPVKVNGAPLTGTSFTDAGLANGTTYTYTVRAVDTSGNASAPSAGAMATPTAASPPTTRTLTLDPVADTTVKQSQPNANFGAVGPLQVDLHDGTLANSAFHAYLRFSIPALAAGERITAARLSVRVSNTTDNGPAVFRTAADWGEAALTWANRGSLAGRTSATAVGNFGAMGSTARSGTNLGGVTGGIVSFELAPESNDRVEFAARGAVPTDRPQLVLTIQQG